MLRSARSDMICRLERSNHLSAVRGAARPRTYRAVADGILDLIASGPYREGARLPPDRELAGTLGVSRNTLREALLALEILGILDVRHGSGIYVADRTCVLNSPQLLALGIPFKYLEARRSLEPSIATLCAHTATPDNIADLARTVASEKAVTASPDPAHIPSRLSQIGLSYHAQLLAYCGNPFLAAAVGPLLAIEANPLWSLANRLVLQNPRAQEEQLRSHALVLQAIEEHDGPRAASLMAEHIDCMTSLFPPRHPGGAETLSVVQHPSQSCDRHNLHLFDGGSSDEHPADSR